MVDAVSQGQDSAENNDRATSQVNLKIHRFWETLAIPAGLALVVHAVLSLLWLPLSPLFLFLNWIELGVGMTTIIVDTWFLINT